MFEYITESIKKTLPLGQVIRVLISATLLVSLWGWRVHGTRPIASLTTVLQFLGIPTTELSQTQTWLQAPGRSQVAVAIGTLMILIGVVGAAARRPIPDADANAFPTAWLGVLVVWQSVSARDFPSPAAVAVTVAFYAAGLALIWKLTERSSRPHVGWLALMMILNGLYAVFAIIAILTQGSSRPPRKEPAQA